MRVGDDLTLEHALGFSVKALTRRLVKLPRLPMELQRNIILRNIGDLLRKNIMMDEGYKHIIFKKIMIILYKTSRKDS